METWNIKDFKNKYNNIYEAWSPVFKKDFTEIINKLPEFFYKKWLFDIETKKYYISFSLVEKEGFREYAKINIKEPNESFINLIINL